MCLPYVFSKVIEFLEIITLMNIKYSKINRLQKTNDTKQINRAQDILH